MRKIPLKIDDTPLISRKEVTKELAKRLNGSFATRLPLEKERKIKRELEEKQSPMLIIPFRRELIYWLPSFSEVRDKKLKAEIEGILEHEYAHLFLLRQMPHYKILHLCMDSVLISYLEGLDSKWTGKLLGLILEALTLHTQWVHEGYCSMVEINTLKKYRENTDRETRLKSLIKRELRINDYLELRARSHEIGLTLFDIILEKSQFTLPELINFLHGFYSKWKLKGTNKTFISSYIPDYLLKRFASALIEEDRILRRENLRDFIEKIEKVFPSSKGPLTDRIERIEKLQYEPPQKLKEKLLGNLETNPVCLIPEEFKYVYRALWEWPLKEAILNQYITCDLNKKERILWTSRTALAGINKKGLMEVLIGLQELKDVLLQPLIEGIRIKYKAIEEGLTLYEWLKIKEDPSTFFKEGVIDNLEELQPRLQEKFTSLLNVIKKWGVNPLLNLTKML